MQLFPVFIPATFTRAGLASNNGENSFVLNIV